MTTDKLFSPHNLDDNLIKQHKIGSRIPARRHKLLGDLYLMAGLYKEATDNYISASEEFKSFGDAIWQGVSQEGLQISLFMQSHVRFVCH